MEKVNIYQKLSNIQNELKAPKGQRNSFGNYNYRSCEDILEAVKPLCKKNNVVLVLPDELVNIGTTRYYIKATATLYDLDNCDKIENTAYAREEETKKGMDASQITGTASSYARKYALNGLFNIDDTKDADTDEYTKKTKQTNENEFEDMSIQETQKQYIQGNLSESNLNSILGKLKVNSIDELNYKQAHDIEVVIENAIKKKNLEKKEVF